MAPHLKRNTSLEDAARRYYDPKLPYHNFAHIRNVMDAAEKIADRCDAASVSVDWNVVYFSLLFHDAGYFEDHRAKGFSSKEAYSAAIAETELKKGGISKGTIDLVKQAILSTARVAKCVSVEDRVVRAADLSEIAADFDTFLRNTENLKKEQELLHGRSFTWQEWLVEVRETIGYYLSQPIWVSSEKEVRKFEDQAKRNLAELEKRIRSSSAA